MSEEQLPDLRGLVEQMAKALVDSPSEVSATVIDEEGVVELEVAPAEMGKVIGKQGRTARAMRTILSAAGAKQNKRWQLEILE
ncbi:MAG TPA: KH domain-containing protein [Terriglobales bacterium]|nr:KH domain-containing protein [Terriglobales bacterium]